MNDSGWVIVHHFEGWAGDLAKITAVAKVYLSRLDEVVMEPIT